MRVWHAHERERFVKRKKATDAFSRFFVSWTRLYFPNPNTVCPYKTDAFSVQSQSWKKRTRNGRAAPSAPRSGRQKSRSKKRSYDVLSFGGARPAMRAAVASIADVGLVGVDTHRRRGPNQASRRVWCPSVPRKRESCRVMRRPRAIEKQAPVLFDFAYLTTTPGDEPVLAETATPPWICLLRDTSFRKGGTARCARNGKPPAGVTPVPQCWKTLRHDAISGAVAMSTKQNNTSEHVRVDANTKHTTKTHPVLVALARRVRDNTKPGSRHDGMKIGLAVEGGGMKGVISAGALGGLLELGLYDAFDAVYGSSAGAMNLTYFLAEQPEGVDCYEDDLVDGRFLDVRRLPTTKTQRRLVGSKYGRAPAMDVNFLVDAVMDAGQTGRRLDFQAVIASPLTFQIVATSLDTLTPVMLGSPFHSKFDLKRSLVSISHLTHSAD